MESLTFWIIIFFFIYIVKQKKSNNRKKKDKYIIEIQKFEQELYDLKKDYITYVQKDKIKEKYKLLYKHPNMENFNKDLIIRGFMSKYKSLDHLINKWNEEFVEKELIENKEMFNNISEKSLDEQQRRAVVVDEMNNLVLAGAGSGKTLTISAKVKYLVEKKNIDPDEILLISFTKKAANEMTERIGKGLNIDVEANTFHKIGLDIITNNRKERPDVVEEGLLNKIIYKYFTGAVLKDKELMTQLLTFIGYYFSIPKDLSEFKNLGERNDHYRRLDFETIKGKYIKEKVIRDEMDIQKGIKQTIQGETVKSLEELMISNFLYLNGIDYIYEYKYPYEPEDKYRKHYRPDFYLTEYDIYLEHFGITKDYRAPWLSLIEEKKYLEGITWKRNIHIENETKLLETYSYYNKNGLLLVELERILKEEGVEFKKVNIDEIYKRILQNKDENYFKNSSKLFGTFIGLFKSNGFSQDEFVRLKKEVGRYNNVFLRNRAELFLNIIEPIYIEYEHYLKKNKLIDFNDMINMARGIVEKDNLNFNYKYIIIDEYQDISMSRYKLIKAIRDRCDAKIMCVGDDWQSIYRFAGSDIDLFTSFEEHFGYYELLKIENTYRNSKELINIAGKFVMENSHQLKKDLKSSKRHSNPLRIFTYEDGPSMALKKAIEEIVFNFGVDTEITILGRNNFDMERIEDNLEDEEKEFKIIENDKGKKIIYKKYPRLEIEYLTVHRSKGLEGNNVIVINLVNNSYGFPNMISDDPILSLVLTKLDDFEFAEERRLFYVALTRTKNSTYLIAPAYRQSIFCEELVSKFNMKCEPSDQEASITDNPNCPKCEKGYIVVRKSGTGNDFLGCTNYPYCDYTSRNLEIMDNQIKCSSCGGYMVNRVGTYGEFYGCTNYPLCKKTLNIEVLEKETNEYIKDEKYIKKDEDEKFSNLIEENNKKDKTTLETNLSDEVVYDKENETNIKQKIYKEFKANNKFKDQDSVKGEEDNKKDEADNYSDYVKENHKEDKIIFESNFSDEIKGFEFERFNEEIGFNKENEIHIKKEIIINKGKYLVDEFLGVDSRVTHSVFGNGIIVSSDKEIIRVEFDNDERVSFTYDACKKSDILKPLDKINNVSIDNLMRQSDYYWENEIFNEEALLVNKNIVEGGSKIIKYQLRLADCYKNLNLIEEALEIYKKVSRVDKNNKVALDNLAIYGKGLYQRYEDKPYVGAYRDVGTPPEDGDGTY